MNPVTITEPSLIVIINRLYKDGMSDIELYEVSKQAWRANKQRLLNVKYVIAVYNSTIKEIYEVEEWFDVLIKDSKNRYGFNGKPAPDKIRDKYLNQSAIKYKGNGSPIRYINC